MGTGLGTRLLRVDELPGSAVGDRSRWGLDSVDRGSVGVRVFLVGFTVVVSITVGTFVWDSMLG
jgi:hypothetical protein